MNKATFISLIIIAASGGYWIGKNHNIPDKVAPSAALIKPKNIIPLTAPKLREVNLENNLQRKNSLIEKAKPDLAAEKLEVMDKRQHQIDAIKTDYEFKQRSESFTNSLIKNQETKPWFDLGSEMLGRFDVEEVDHNWANAEEGRLRSVFAEEQTLAGIAVKSTTCKSTQCQVIISVSDHNHADETTNAIINALSAEKFSHIIIDRQIQHGETIFYVSSNEKGFEFN